MSSPPPHAMSTSTLSSLPPTSHQPPYTLTHLDTLLTTYLTYLDTYTRQRTQLSSSFSTGFLHLAQAQRSSMLPPGQRYGQEMYDQRMKAGRRVKMVESLGTAAGADAGATEEDEGMRFEIEVYTYADADGNPTPSSTAQTSSSSPSPPSPTPTNPEAASQEPTTQTQTQQQATPYPSSTTAPASAPTPLSTAASTSPPAKPPKPRIPNPISQFALLPPPPLRQSQAAFTTALASIATLLNTSRAMDLLAAEIERVRRALGLSLDGDFGTEEAVVDEMNSETETATEIDTKEKNAEEEEEEEEEEEGRRPPTTATAAVTPASATTCKRRNLAGRSKVSEPRSRVLKLGT